MELHFLKVSHQKKQESIHIFETRFTYKIAFPSKYNEATHKILDFHER
jgi:hypothetical protein